MDDEIGKIIKEAKALIDSNDLSETKVVFLKKVVEALYKVNEIDERLNNIEKHLVEGSIKSYQEK